MKSVATIFCLILLCNLFNLSIAAAQNKSTRMIRGCIRDELGEPIDKAQVQVYSKEVLVRETHTDAKGRYELKELPEGKLTIRAWSLGFVTEKRAIQLKAGKKKLDFALKAGTVEDTEKE